MSEPTPVTRFPALIESAAGVLGEVDLERVLRRLVVEARAATGARYAALGVLGDHGVLSDFIYEGMTEDEAARVGTLPKGRGVLGTVIRERRTIVLDSIADHPDAFGFPEHHPQMGSFLGVAVTAGGDVFGNLYLTDKDGGFSERDVAVVEALSRIAGSAVSTARLQERLRRLAVVEDRDRIARDLHDSVIQDLFAVGLSLQGIAQRVNETHAAATLDNAVDRLDHAVEALRSYIFQLKSTSDTKPAIDERLQELVARMGSAYPSEVRLQVELETLEDEILEEELMKIVNEALSNALRHAEAPHVSVRVRVRADTLEIRVQDDGSGFDTSQPTTGFGLNNLAHRSARLGGTFEIDTTPGEGTIVEVKLPASSVGGVGQATG